MVNLYTNPGEVIFPVEFVFLVVSMLFPSLAIAGIIYVLMYVILGRLSGDIKMFLAWSSGLGHLGYQERKEGKLNWDKLRKKFTLKQVIGERESIPQMSIAIIAGLLLVFGWTVPLTIDTYTTVSAEGIDNNRFFGFREKRYDWDDIELVEINFRSDGEGNDLYVSPNFIVRFNDSKKVNLGQDRWPSPEGFSLLLPLLVENGVNIKYAPPNHTQANELLHGRSSHYPNYLKLKEEIEKTLVK